MYSHPTINVRIVLSSLFSTLFLLTTLVQLQSQSVEVNITPTFPNLPLNNARITKMQFAPDGSNRWFICEQNGVLWTAKNSVTTNRADTLLDFRQKIVSTDEAGLLGLGFDPDFLTNRFIYLNYTIQRNDSLYTLITRLTLTATDPPEVLPSSEQVLMEIYQPYPTHNGGEIAFGPQDHYLYISTGDGGGFGDPFNRAQDLRSPLGKILCIDVKNPAPGKAYSIPETNPFAGNSHYREEIYAWGLRNPWRFSFDKETGRLWAGDVGQNASEEINIIERGGNYGWRVMEGFHCFDRDDPLNLTKGCDSTSLIAPLYEYLHVDLSSGYSITGGFTYHGQQFPELEGWYIYGDLSTGQIWGLQDDGSGTITNIELIDTDHLITTFGVDDKGELYYGTLGQGIYKLQ